MSRPTKVIRNYNDANRLLSMGHKIVKIDRDKYNRSFFVFIFEQDKTLIDDLNSLTKKQV